MAHEKGKEYSYVCGEGRSKHREKVPVAVAEDRQGQAAQTRAMGTGWAQREWRAREVAPLFGRAPRGRDLPGGHGGDMGQQKTKNGAAGRTMGEGRSRKTGGTCLNKEQTNKVKNRQRKGGGEREKEEKEWQERAISWKVAVTASGGTQCA